MAPYKPSLAGLSTQHFFLLGSPLVLNLERRFAASQERGEEVDVTLPVLSAAQSWWEDSPRRGLLPVSTDLLQIRSALSLFLIRAL